MNIDLWYAVLAVVLVGAAVGLGCRWWYRRQLETLAYRLAKLDTTHQSTLRSMSQARKQVDDLQRLVSEYRRKLTSIELARRRLEAKAPILDPSTVAVSPAALPNMRLPGWADTQPM
jgi:predicted negative regulator of RcsB-dependent stress response